MLHFKKRYNNAMYLNFIFFLNDMIKIWLINYMIYMYKEGFSITNVNKINDTIPTKVARKFK